MHEVPNATEDAPKLPSSRRRRWPWAVGGAVIAAGLFVAFWFQAQKLVIDERAEEPIPTVDLDTTTTSTPESQDVSTSAPDTSTSSSAEVTGPVEIARGEFVSLDHGTTGTALVLELGDGERIVRLEGLDTSNGPDLFLYLSTNNSAGEEATFDDDFFNLGRLTANQGDQNYELPIEVDLGHFASVVIWCDRFDSAFGAADLSVT